MQDSKDSALLGYGRETEEAGEAHMDLRAHWDRVYTTKPSDAVSWFQREPAVSLHLLDAMGLRPST